MPFGMAIHNLRSRFWRTTLTALGITLGVAVVLAIDITNQSTLLSIEKTFERAVGRTELLVIPWEDTDTINGEILSWVEDVPGVLAAAPEVWARTFLADESPGSEARLGARGVEVGRRFELQGVDVEVDPQVRIYSLVEGRMPDLHSYEVVVPSNHAEDRGLVIGDDLVITAPYGRERLEIVGLLDDEGVAVINNGEVGFAPLDVVQEIFDFGNALYEISVQVEPRISSDARALDVLKNELSDVLDGEARPIYPAARGDLVPRMLNTYQIGLTIFSIIAIFVGAFLIYNTFSMTVVERTQEIGMLRAIGMNRGQVLFLVLVEAGILALVGVFLGVGAGILLARGLLMLLGGFLADAAGLITVSLQSLAKSVIVGVLVTFLAALIPAYHATRVSPLEALSARSRTSQRLHPLIWISGLVFLFVGYSGIYLIKWRMQVMIPAGSGSLILLMAGVVLTLPLLIAVLERSSRWIAILLYGNEGSLGSTNVRRSVLRTTLTVACLMISLVMIIGIGTLSHTFKEDVKSWVNSALGGDLFVIASNTMQMRFVNQLLDIPGVEIVTPTRYLDVRVAQASSVRSESQRDRLLFTAIEPETFRQVGDMIFTSGQGDATASWAALNQGNSLFISSVVADEYHLQQGDSLTLLTRRGEHAFKVAAVTTDFTGQGFVVTSTYADIKRWFGEGGADRFTLVLKPDYESQLVAQQIKDRFQDRYHLDIQTTDTIRSSVMSMLDQAFELFDVLSLIGVIIGALGVINTLTMNVIERTREIGGLRSLGMTRKQVVRMVLAESLALGFIGCIYGLSFGYVISKVFVFTSSALSSYEVAYLPTLQPYLLSLLIAFGISQIAALGPARRAVRINIVDAIKHE